jgi:hypothetical protein
VGVLHERGSDPADAKYTPAQTVAHKSSTEA